MAPENVDFLTQSTLVYSEVLVFTVAIALNPNPSYITPILSPTSTMRFHKLSLLAALVQSAAFCSALPVLDDEFSSISLRGAATCENFPKTVAGT